jgi:hypothetical protein
VKHSVRIIYSSDDLISMLCISQNKKVPGWSSCVTWSLLLLAHRDCIEVVHYILYIYTKVLNHAKPVSLSKSNSPTILKEMLVFFFSRNAIGQSFKQLVHRGSYDNSISAVQEFAQFIHTYSYISQRGD